MSELKNIDEARLDACELQSECRPEVLLSALASKIRNGDIPAGSVVVLLGRFEDDRVTVWRYRASCDLVQEVFLVRDAESALTRRLA